MSVTFVEHQLELRYLLHNVWTRLLWYSEVPGSLLVLFLQSQPLDLVFMNNVI